MYFLYFIDVYRKALPRVSQGIGCIFLHKKAFEAKGCISVKSVGRQSMREHAENSVTAFELVRWKKSGIHNRRARAGVSLVYRLLSEVWFSLPRQTCS